MKKTVIIAAAGRGSRLGAGTPKCLVEVNGHAIFEYQLKAFQWADEVRMVVGYKAEEVMRRVASINDKVVFVSNKEYSSTTTLQSYFLGAKGINSKALFIDGDMMISREAGEQLCQKFDADEPFIGVAKELSEQPVYAGVKDRCVQWFSYERKSDYEWANVALLDTSLLEYNHTHFYIQLGKYLPVKALEIERVEIDTNADLTDARQKILKFPDKYNFWR